MHDVTSSSTTTAEATTAARGARGRRLFLGLLMFLLGGCGLAYEYTLSKFASDLLGNSVQQWATMIATMLFAMGLGADLQKHTPQELLAERLIRTQILLGVLGGFAPLLMIYSFALLPQIYILVQYALAFGVGLLIGYEIPLMMRINEQDSPHMRINLAEILKMDYIGALAGALLWTFLLVRYLSISRISLVLGLCSMLGALLCIWFYQKRLQSPKKRLLELCGGVLACSVGLVMAPEWCLHAEQFLYRDRVVESVTTPFQHIVLTESASGNLRCYINGHLQFNQQDEHVYHENLVHPAMQLHGKARSVLILGGGDGLALREVLKYPGVQRVVLVDLDEGMTKLASSHPKLLELNRGSMLDSRLQRRQAQGITQGEAYANYQRSQYQHFGEPHYHTADLHIINIDAAEFVKGDAERFDVVIMDFPDPNSPDLAKLYSRPFYEQLRGCLQPQAVVVQQAGSCVHAKEAFLCIGRTLQAAGFAAVPYHDNVDSFGEWGWWIARQGQDSSQTRAALDNLPSFDVPTRYLHKALVSCSLVFGRDELASQHDDFTSLSEPRVYHYHLQGWNNN